MGERLGHLIRNQEQEIWISLQDVRGEQQIEIRLYERDASAIAELAPGKEGIFIPVDLLPVLVKALSRAQEALMNRGLLYVPPTSQVTQLERGDSVGFGAEERPKSGRRQHPRVPLNIRGECRLLDKKDFWPGKPVAGEVLNVSAGGARFAFLSVSPDSAKWSYSWWLTGWYSARAQRSRVRMPLSRKVQRGGSFATVCAGWALRARPGMSSPKWWLRGHPNPRRLPSRCPHRQNTASRGATTVSGRFLRAGWRRPQRGRSPSPWSRRSPST